MELKKAKCPECGAIIEVNPQATVLTCRFCGSDFSVQKALDKYDCEKDSTLSSNKVNDSSDAYKNLMEVGIQQMNIGQYAAAENYFMQAAAYNPKEWEPNFYRAYCSCNHGKIGDIPNQAIALSNAAVSALTAIKNIQDVAKHDAAFDKILNLCTATYVHLNNNIPSSISLAGFNPFMLENKVSYKNTISKSLTSIVQSIINNADYENNKDSFIKFIKVCLKIGNNKSFFNQVLEAIGSDSTNISINNENIDNNSYNEYSVEKKVSRGSDKLSTIFCYISLGTAGFALIMGILAVADVTEVAGPATFGIMFDIYSLPLNIISMKKRKTNKRVFINILNYVLFGIGMLLTIIGLSLYA